MSIAPEPTAVSPTVQRIVLTVKNRILSGVYPGGEWLPTERSLAEEFQVSRILIRAAVRELEREQLITCPAHRRPIVQTVGPSLEPPQIRNRDIALWIWPQQNWPGTALTIQGIQEVMGEDFRLILGNRIGNTWEEALVLEARFLAQLLRERNVAGVILSYMGGKNNLSLLESLREARIPLVFIDHLPPDGFSGDYVGVNNRRSAERAVKHLIAQGHRKIAHLSNFDSISTVTERRDGYRQALLSSGLPVSETLIRFDPGPSGEDPQQGCEEIAREWMTLPEPPTAIFAVNDIAAYRIMAALRKEGKQIPDDVSVVGFDGIERWMPTLPFLTTVHQPFEEIGRCAMELLKERIASPSSPAFTHTILDTHISLHGSTIPLRARATVGRIANEKTY